MSSSIVIGYTYRDKSYRVILKHHLLAIFSLLCNYFVAYEHWQYIYRKGGQLPWINISYQKFTLSLADCWSIGLILRWDPAGNHAVLYQADDSWTVLAHVPSKSVTVIPINFSLLQNRVSSQPWYVLNTILSTRPCS